MVKNDNTSNNFSLRKGKATPQKKKNSLRITIFEWVYSWYPVYDYKWGVINWIEKGEKRREKEAGKRGKEGKEGKRGKEGEN